MWTYICNDQKYFQGISICLWEMPVRKQLIEHNPHLMKGQQNYLHCIETWLEDGHQSVSRLSVFLPPLKASSSAISPSPLSAHAHIPTHARHLQNYVLIRFWASFRPVCAHSTLCSRWPHLCHSSTFKPFFLPWPTEEGDDVLRAAICIWA